MKNQIPNWRIYFFFFVLYLDDWRSDRDLSIASTINEMEQLNDRQVTRTDYFNILLYFAAFCLVFYTGLCCTVRVRER